MAARIGGVSSTRAPLLAAPRHGRGLSRTEGGPWAFPTAIRGEAQHTRHEASYAEQSASRPRIGASGERSGTWRVAEPRCNSETGGGVWQQISRMRQEPEDRLRRAR